MKIFAIGRNYGAHAAELGNPQVSKPIVFMKPATALLSDGTTFTIPSFSADVHYELELVLRIEKTAKEIAAANAWDYVKEFTLGIDFTARDLQSQLKGQGLPWELAKAFDGSAIIGTRWFPISPSTFAKTQFELLQDGKSKQNATASEMIFDVPTLIEFVSTYFTLEAGDLLYTGTPAGVGKVSVGEHYEGLLGDEKVLDFSIR